MTNRFTPVMSGLLAAVMIVGLTGAAVAQEVTLRVHHFLPPMSPAHQGFIQPWAEAVMEQSQGRIEVEVYPAMQLGGSPVSLYDQARDGVVDVIWTLPGYTPGRFPISEVFEMPFMAASGEATSRAAWRFYERHLREEFGDVHVVMMHVHGPGLFHIRGAEVNSIDDLDGLTVRAPTRVINQALGLLGAEPVGMPVPAVPEAISRGVIDGTVLPWEVTRALRLAELVDSHSAFGGDRGLYTASFVFAMNRDTYASLPEDLRAVIDANSGIEMAAMMGRAMDEADLPAYDVAVDAGNTIITLPDSERTRAEELLQPIIDGWVAAMNDRGLDGEALLQEARDLIAEEVAALDM